MGVSMKAYQTTFFALLLILLLSPFLASAQVAQACDVDNDNDVDRNDINLIIAARNQPSSGVDDPRDANGDGIINILDMRLCFLQCTLSRCAIIDPPVDVPIIELSPASVDFGDVFVGSSATQSLIVNNTGSATLSVSNISSSGQPFSVFPATFVRHSPKWITTKR